MTWLWIETSRAETGSSQMMSLAGARARGQRFPLLFVGFHLDVQ